jgi:hypothetical protein
VIRDNEVRTGLHPLQFIETRRLTITKKPMLVNTHGSVNMANVVEGDEVEIHSLDQSFSPFIVHYAETFIIPANVNQYYIKKLTPGVAMVVQAYVRST